MTTAEVLVTAAGRGVVLRAEDGRVKWWAPAGALTDELRAVIGERKTELLAILAPPGLPLQPPDYEVPPEWQPAPEWTPEEQAVYDATLGEMARVLDDGDLLDWLGRRFGARFFVDEKGALRAEGAAQVPATVREVVRDRQAVLVALLAGECAGDSSLPGGGEGGLATIGELTSGGATGDEPNG
jgi:hypothetical protein